MLLCTSAAQHVFESLKMFFWHLIREILGLFHHSARNQSQSQPDNGNNEHAITRNKREIQKLTGRVVVLNRFISHLTYKCMPFFKLLKGNKKFEWNDKRQLAFDELKRYQSTPPILVKPLTGERLFLYLAVMEVVVSTVLMQDLNGEQ